MKMAFSVSLLTHVPPFHYRWLVKSPQIPTILMIVNVTPNWWGSWADLSSLGCCWLYWRIYKQSIFRDGREFLALLIASRLGEFLADCLPPSSPIGVISLSHCISWSTWQGIWVAMLGPYIALHGNAGGLSHPLGSQSLHKLGNGCIVRLYEFPLLSWVASVPHFLGLVPVSWWWQWMERSMCD